MKNVRRLRKLKVVWSIHGIFSEAVERNSKKKQNGDQNQNGDLVQNGCSRQNGDPEPNGGSRNDDMEQNGGLEQKIKKEQDMNTKSDTHETPPKDTADATSYQSFKIDDNLNLPPLVAIVLTFIYMLLGSIMYSQWEDWTYLDAFFFVFGSISTIGFGDIVPKHNNFFLLSFLYILFGLTLVAMVINVLVQSFTETFQQVRHERYHIARPLKTFRMSMS